MLGDKALAEVLPPLQRWQPEDEAALISAYVWLRPAKRVN